MDRLVYKLTNTIVVIIVAVMKRAGHILVQEVARKKKWLGNSREKMKHVVEQYKQRLRVTFGCVIAKGMGGWM